jgi:plastocyanin/S1-C subfamily serine protease
MWLLRTTKQLGSGIRRGVRLSRFVALVLLIIMNLASVSVRADLNREAVDRLASATVLIVARVVEVNRGLPIAEYERRPLGSGVLVSDDGLLLTASHVVDLTALEQSVANEENVTGLDLDIADEFVIYVVDSKDDDPDPRYRARQELDDVTLDLAVLKITGDEDGRRLSRPLRQDRSPIPLAPSGTLNSDNEVEIFGYPEFGTDAFAAEIGSKTIDNVSSGIRSLEPVPNESIVRFILLDATVSGGSSGGAVVDSDGRLVGIVTAARAGSGGGSVGVAIPIDWARAVLADAGWTEATPMPSTATPVPPTNTPSPTATLVPPTLTPEPTPSPTYTPEPTPTVTPVETGAGAGQNAEGLANAEIPVYISDFAYSPNPIEIAVGNAVTWFNEDQVPHTATGENRDVLQSGTIPPGASFTQVFWEAGEFGYFCEFHPGMTGTIIVVD